MITYFPTPYIDESLYSIIARYHVHKGNIWPGSTNEDLFNTNKIRKEEEAYLRHLTSFIKKIKVFSDKYTSKYFIDYHTQIPIVRPFREKSWYDQINLNLDRTSKSGSKVIYPSYLPKQYASKAKNISPKEHFYYCPECLKIQYHQHGECYWNRLHQIPGFYVCSTHKVPLVKHEINYRKFKKVDFIIPKLEDASKKGNQYKENIMEILINLSNDLEYLLRKNFSSFSDQYYFDKYNVLMKLKGVGFPFNKRQKLLGEMVLDFYPEEILKLFNSNFDLLDKHTWLETIITESRVAYCHPLRHVLIMRVLCGSVKNFFENEFKYEPFGKKPWICMNPLSDHYLKTTINKIEISVNERTRNVQGDFICDCGYSYRLRDGEIDPTKIKNFNNRVLIRGELFNKSLLKLVEEKLMIKDIADITMINRNAVAKLIKELTNEKQLDKKKQHMDHKNKKTLDYREEWLKIREQNPSLPRHKLNYLNRKIYVWLNRNDKEWLIKHSPERIRSVPRKVNHAERDLELLRKANQINQEWTKLEQDNKRLIRKSLNQLYELLGKNIYQKADQYPLTVDYLKSIQESLLDFQKRRIIHILDKKYYNTVAPVRDVKYFAGLSNNTSEILEAYLIKLVENHNHKIKP